MRLLCTNKADEFDMKRLCETLSRSRRLVEVRITTFTAIKSDAWLDKITDEILECFESLRGVENVVFPMECGEESTAMHGVGWRSWAITGTDEARDKIKKIMTSRP